jgi:hypothetical protein
MSLLHQKSDISFPQGKWYFHRGLDTRCCFLGCDIGRQCVMNITLTNNVFLAMHPHVLNKKF